MSLPTRHLRLLGVALQQLYVFDEDDRYVLEEHALTDVDAEIFRDEPNHMVSEWLATISHEWRNVPMVPFDEPARGELKDAAK